MVIEPNCLISVNTIIELIDAIYDEYRFSSILETHDLIPSTMSLSNGQEQWNIVEVRTTKQSKKEKSFGSDFFVYLVEGTRDSIENEYCLCL